MTALKVAVFVALMLVGGRRIVPWILHQVARAGSRELFTLAVLAIALGIAYGSAHLFDVSFALGAFFAGVVLAETDLSHQAAENSLPLQDAFAVLFFVSVGMLFDPSVVLERPLELLGVLFVIVVGKSLAAFAIVLAFGYPVRTALTISASLAQIGEFSFILAGLGVALGLLPPEGRDLILAGALLSITFNPFAFGMIEPMTRWLDRHPRVTALLERRNRRHRRCRRRAGRRPARSRGDRRLRPRRQRRRSRARSAGPEVRRHRDASTHRRGAARAARSSRSRAMHPPPACWTSRRSSSARLLVIASPDGFQARRILELARERNPRIAVVVRTHSSSELAYLIRQGVDRAVMGELELALEMTDYALRSLGVPEERSKLVTQWLRTQEISRPK